jgi:predicted DNA-binding protein
MNKSYYIKEKINVGLLVVERIYFKVNVASN